MNGESVRAKRSENNNVPEADGACSPCTTGPAAEERRRKNGAVALQCAYCGERARTRAELEAHTRAHSGAAAARHKCLICDEVLPSAAVLAEHKLTHCKVRVVYPLMNSSFFTNQTLCNMAGKIEGSDISFNVSDVTHLNINLN